jgi:hypothetical protein
LTLHRAEHFAFHSAPRKSGFFIHKAYILLILTLDKESGQAAAVLDLVTGLTFFIFWARMNPAT